MNPWSLMAGLASGWLGERWLMRRIGRAGSTSVAVAIPATAVDRVMTTPDGGEVRWIEAGTGRPLVLLHGITLEAEAWHHQFALADRCRVMAVDLRGHGRSRAGSNGATIGDNAADLAQLLVDEDLHDVVLAGHSMGGMVVGRFLATADPSVVARVSGVAFVDSAVRAPVPPARFQGSIDRVLQAGPIAGFTGTVPDNDFGRLAVMATFGRRPSLGDLQLVADSYDRLPRAVYWSAWPSIFAHDVRAELAARDDLDRLRVAIVVGALDRLTPVRCANDLATAFPAAEVIVVPHVGHQMMLEDPEGLNEVLGRLLDPVVEVRRSSVDVDR